MRRLIADIYVYLKMHRWLLWGSLSVVTVICALLASSLRFEEDIYEFLPETSDTERYTFVSENFRTANEIVINVGMGDPSAEPDLDLLTGAVEEICDSLLSGSLAGHISGVTYRIDGRDIASVAAFTASHLPFYLDTADYVSLKESIRPGNIRRQMEADRNMLGGAAGPVLRSVMQTDPLMLSADLLKGLDSFRYNDNYRLVDGYIFTSDTTEAVITVESVHPSSETSHNKELIKGLDALSESVSASYGGAVSVSPFGAAYISISNADRIKKDSIITISVSTVLILLLLSLAYKDLKVTLSLAATLLFGMVFSFGVCGALTDSISVIAVGLGSVIIGIAANYPLHYLDHRYQGYDDRQTILDIAKPLTIGNITTVGAFLSLLFISSGAMNDLGLFAAMILVGTILFVLIYLPHILRLKHSGEKRDEPSLLFSRIGRLHPERNGWVILSVVLLTVLFGVTGRDTGFDADLNRINYMTDSQRERMEALLQQENSSYDILYVFSEGKDIDGALEACERAADVLHSCRRDSLINRILGISGYLPSMGRQQERLSAWNAFWKDRGEEVADMVDEYSLEAGFRPGVFDSFRRMITEEQHPEGVTGFAPIKSLLADNYIISVPERTMILTPVTVSREKSDAARRYLSANLPEDSFTFSQGSLIRDTVDALSSDFDTVLTFCSILVFLFLIVSFRSAELAVIAFIPLAVSWIWILGIMGMAGMDFNIVNIILATFIFGMGDDYTIFITEGCLEENRTGRTVLTTFKNTVLLSALIIFVGIGSLAFARHPSLNQLGIVTVIGMFCVVVLSFIIPPFFFRLLTVKKGKHREYPLTFLNMGKTLFSFTYMVLATTGLAVEGFFLLTLGGRSPHHKQVYHRSIRRLSRFAIKHIPGIRYNLENPSGETFCIPSVITVNHQSHLDLMALLSLSENIIVLTNRWVHNFPFYAPLVRYADFLPVEGLASGESIPELRELVSQGYSIAVFPEGTRSADGTLGKFRKGAFHISDLLGLDIVPVVLHGFSDVLPKNDLLLRSGSVTARVLPRIGRDELDDIAEGNINGTLAVSKAVRRSMAAALSEMSVRLRTSRYFRDRVLSLYLYRGDSLRSKVRRSLDGSGCFSGIVDSMPREGEVIIEERGWGELTLVAALARPDVRIISRCSAETSVILRNIALHLTNITIQEQYGYPRF